MCGTKNKHSKLIALLLRPKPRKIYPRVRFISDAELFHNLKAAGLKQPEYQQKKLL